MDSTVFVVDPDPQSRAAVRRVAEEMELPCEEHKSGWGFLDVYEYSRPGCLVLSLRIPDIGGLQIQNHLAQNGIPLPVIFVSGHADVPTAVRAMRAGAVQFHQKPVDARELWDSIQEAMYFDQDRRRELKERHVLKERVARLSPKEREVLELMAEGQSVKEISEKLEVGVRSVELRRAKLMEKLEVESLTELFRFTETFFDGHSPLNLNSLGWWQRMLESAPGRYWHTGYSARRHLLRRVNF